MCLGKLSVISKGWFLYPINAGRMSAVTLPRPSDRLRKVINIVLVILTCPTAVLAAEEAARQPHWWQVVSGVIAIPAGIVGLIYSIVLIRKTGLEARKTELEIQDKERDLMHAAEAGGMSHELVTPLVKGERLMLLLLRFVLLSVALMLWGILESIYGMFLGGTFLALQKVVETDFMWVMIPFFLLSNLPKIGKWIIILGLGLPLFREIASLLGMNVKDVLTPWYRK